MNIDNREKIEWLNYWIEDANKEKKRVILLGDSVTREIRKKLSSFIKAEYAVDLIAMSYSILDDSALKEIKHFFETTLYEYDFIVYQMGAHHGYYISCIDSEGEAVVFANKSKEILNFLTYYGKNVISMSATLERSYDKEGNVVENHNKEVEKRNEILKIVSDELNLMYLDLNREIDYRRIRYTDWCHFCEDCYEYVSNLIVDAIFPDIQCVSSNRISTMEEMEKKLKIYKKIYIYGKGARGENIKKYLQKQNYFFGGFIVSEEYMSSLDNAISVEQVETDNALIIVTPIEAAIYKKLNKEQIDYVSLSSDVYEILSENN